MEDDLADQLFHFKLACSELLPDPSPRSSVGGLVPLLSFSRPLYPPLLPTHLLDDRLAGMVLCTLAGTETTPELFKSDADLKSPETLYEETLTKLLDDVGEPYGWPSLVNFIAEDERLGMTLCQRLICRAAPGLLERLRVLVPLSRLDVGARPWETLLDTALRVLGEGPEVEVVRGELLRREAIASGKVTRESAPGLQPRACAWAVGFGGPELCSLLLPLAETSAFHGARGLLELSKRNADPRVPDLVMAEFSRREAEALEEDASRGSNGSGRRRI